MASVQGIVPCLWFDGQAEEAARFYVGVFGGDSGVDEVTRFTEAGQEVHGRPPGSVLTVEFRLAGQRFTALNGGPQFRFTEAISLQALCDDQAETDRLWDALCAGGEPSQCGWLKDRYGLSWQVVPVRLNALLFDPDPARAARVMTALLQMTKLDLAALERAHAGG